MYSFTSWTVTLATLLYHLLLWSFTFQHWFIVLSFLIFLFYSGLIHWYQEIPILQIMLAILYTNADV